MLTYFPSFDIPPPLTAATHPLKKFVRSAFGPVTDCISALWNAVLFAFRLPYELWYQWDRTVTYLMSLPGELLTFVASLPRRGISFAASLPGRAIHSAGDFIWNMKLKTMVEIVLFVMILGIISAALGKCLRVMPKPDEFERFLGLKKKKNDEKGKKKSR